jgi:CheY-like chemotaxis protein
LARPTILVVEDDADIRDMLATLLELAGFVPIACDTAEQGLNALRENSFDLILTDYALPRHSGVWLLQQATTEGLIDNTPVIIVTAHPQVSGAAGYEIVQKPFDLDDLVDRVRRRLESDRPARRHPARTSTGTGNGSANGDGDGNGAPCPEPVELILYVSAQSPQSAAAIRNIKKVLSRFSPSQVKLTVCDLSTDPAGGIEDGVAFTPTLVRRAPGPRTFILGHTSSQELLLEVLGDCDLEE